MKCEMCGCDMSKIVRIRNRKNGNELHICQSCAVKNGFIEMPPGTHWECRYCACTEWIPDPDAPIFMACGKCGGDWEVCKILVED